MAGGSVTGAGAAVCEAAGGAPGLGWAIVGTASLEAFVEFYSGQLGMDASRPAELGGEAFERHWGLPPGSRARSVLMSVGSSAVGRVLGIEFAARGRRWVADESRGPFIGYWNLNFYVDGIVEACERLAAQDFPFWSRPISHQVGQGAGAPTEAIFLGPDRVAINLVELGGATGSTVDELRQETAALPRSRTGYSQVATTAHATRDLAAALAFHREVLGLWPTIDTVLESPAVNELTGRPREARTRVVWMRGAHPYGKVALSQPLNYALADRASDTSAPAIGYLAQGFVVPDLARALERAAACGAPRLGEPDAVALAAGPPVRAALLRSPGSGALVQLVQAVGA
jgi:catechol 2,3-dioxygenase-like lactoylglutathione lyase family enzyme